MYKALNRMFKGQRRRRISVCYDIHKIYAKTLAILIKGKYGSDCLRFSVNSDGNFSIKGKLLKSRLCLFNNKLQSGLNFGR